MPLPQVRIDRSQFGLDEFASLTIESFQSAGAANGFAQENPRHIFAPQSFVKGLV
jgi:hypothetical protein